MSTLEQFQRQTSDALRQGDAHRPDAVAGAEAGQRPARFDIYRNNRAVSLVDNLRATYPAVHQLVGEEFFSAAARAFIDAHPPKGPVMAEYGAALGEFLTALPGSQSIPYIGDVARIDWARNESYHAADAPILDLQTLASLAPEVLLDVTLDVRPCVRVIRSQWPAGSLWSASSGGGTEDVQIDLKHAECVVVVRPRWDVFVHSIAPSTAAFMLRLFDGASVGESAAACLERDAEFDTGQNISHLLGLGLFSGYAEPR